ncbi:LysR family transcriptional regulator [Bradyrhizobium japonicum]|nr:LysR family transcriptional regulator [Bradyrhizobium japonicum]MCS3540248.1 DNA-binding transcriptional LysR family regulator [Bradyrhizobium japonicum]MCS3992549.1 DNA-binding transcriptional LysR family regulator [Bradyrhizobium japonicum]MCS4012640.1 DNA-binding transcriptional LysR family regulator [Bradyrhizobium japonicum]MCS4208628.1 DNA-binding transcriptional LysR family regulator [Bradyrhizobium japonicum]MDH6172878.1 DNA-binding transcriptional LysR family regulator [Bradyrhizob
MLEASRQFGMTQSAVSQAVRRAEAAVGVAFFNRSRRPLTPTRAGRILADRVLDLNRDFDVLLSTLRAAAEQSARVDLRLGLVDSYAGTVGAHLVKELMTGSIALSLSAWSGLAHSHAEALVRRMIDAAITCDAMDVLYDVERFPFYREPYLLVVPRGLEAEFADLDLREILARHRLVRHSERSYVGAQVERHLSRLGIRPPRAFEFDTSDSLVAMVATGMGVAITTPLCLLQGLAHAAQVSALPLPGPGFFRELLLVTRRGDLSSLAPRIAEMARMSITTQAMPRVRTLVPWFTQDY